MNKTPKAKMPTIEEVIDRIQSEHSMGPYEYLDYKDCVIAMKSYACEVLDYAAEKARATSNCQIWNCEGESVDKSSILNIKEELK